MRLLFVELPELLFELVGAEAAESRPLAVKLLSIDLLELLFELKDRFPWQTAGFLFLLLRRIT